MRLDRKGVAMKSLLASLKKVNFYPEGYEDYLCGLSICKCLESDIQFRKTTFATMWSSTRQTQHLVRRPGKNRKLFQ